MFQCDKGGMHKLVVILSPATGDSQSLAAKGNCILVPQGTPCSLLYGAPCPMVVTLVSKEGQSTVEIGGAKALGADCEFMCPMGGKLTAQSHGQAIATHNEASAGLQIASFIADFVPIVGTIKSVIEVVTGVDPITGEATSRLAAAAGIVPGGKAIAKGGKVIKAIAKGEKGAAKVGKAAAKTEKVAASSTKAASKERKLRLNRWLNLQRNRMHRQIKLTKQNQLLMKIIFNQSQLMTTLPRQIPARSMNAINSSLEGTWKSRM